MSEAVREYCVTEQALLKAIMQEAKCGEAVVTGDGIKIESRTKTVEYKFKGLSDNFLQTIKKIKNGKQN